VRTNTRKPPTPEPTVVPPPRALPTRYPGTMFAHPRPSFVTDPGYPIIPGGGQDYFLGPLGQNGASSVGALFFEPFLHNTHARGVSVLARLALGRVYPQGPRSGPFLNHPRVDTATTRTIGQPCPHTVAHAHARTPARPPSGPPQPSRTTSLGVHTPSTRPAPPPT
jgi:hypothetical protein